VHKDPFSSSFSSLVHAESSEIISNLALVLYSDDPIDGACVAVQHPSVVKIDARPLGENLQLQLPKETKCGIDG
jgi:hypothetical protein